MSQLWVTAQHEALRALRQRTLRVGALLLSALFVVGVGLEVVRHREQRRERAALSAQVDAEWRAQPDRHPHRASHFGSFAFREPAPLGFFDPGLESYAGTATFLEPHQRNTSAFSAAAQSSELSRFGSPSAAFILQVLVPLLLFCITAGSVAGERESGTWTLSLAQGATARALLLGKALGVLLIACVWLAPLLALTAAVAIGFGLVDATSDTAARAVLAGVAYVAYLALCAAFGVLVSALHRRARSALASSLALWAAVWLLVPRLATAVASDAHPVPSRARFEMDIGRAIRGLGDSHDPNNPHFARLREETLAKYGVRRIEDLPVNFGGVVMAESERLSTAAFNEFHDRLTTAYREQADAALRFGLYLPRLAIGALSTALAGTDVEHLARFEADVEAHRYAFIQRLNELHTTRIRYENDRAQRVSADEWDHFDGFEHAHPTVGWALSHAGPAALALAFWLSLGAALLLVLGERRSIVR